MNGFGGILDTLHGGYELTEKDFFFLIKFFFMYENELLPIQQKRNIAKSKRKLF